MLLAMDVGNTNTVLGVFRGNELLANWRLTTARDQTVDEYGILTRELFTLDELAATEIKKAFPIRCSKQWPQACQCLPPNTAAFPKQSRMT